MPRSSLYARDKEQPWLSFETLWPEHWPYDKCRWKRLVAPEVCDSSDFIAGTSVVDPGDAHQPHHHPDASELYFVLHGEAIVTVDGQVIRATPGTAIYIPKGTTHSIENNGRSPFEFFFAFNTILDRYEGTIWDYAA